MQDNIIIENLEFTEEMYKKVNEENTFNDDGMHGIGDDSSGNS